MKKAKSSNKGISISFFGAFTYDKLAVSVQPNEEDIKNDENGAISLPDPCIDEGEVEPDGYKVSFIYSFCLPNCIINDILDEF